MSAPGISTVAQRLIVQSQYDNNGRLLRVDRTVDPPGQTNIGTVTTQYRYDPAGRTIAEVAPDLQVDSTVYDPAGNATTVLTRRKDPATGQPYQITMTYDARNQLLQRSTPAVKYAQRTTGIPSFFPRPAQDTPYPRYPNDPDGTSYTIPADVATFTYDVMGHLLTANNYDAKVTKTYYQSGRDSTETQRIRTYTGNDTTTHVYTIAHFYDLNGRRTKLKHPSQLAPVTARGTADSVMYSYDPGTGKLSSVTDLLDSVFSYSYNLRQELATLRMPGGITRSLTYYDDGSLATDVISNASSSTHRFTANTLRSASLTYDARGKLVSTRDQFGVQHQLWGLLLRPGPPRAKRGYIARVRLHGERVGLSVE